MRTHLQQVVEDCSAPKLPSSYDPGFYAAANTEEHAAICLYVVELAAKLDGLAKVNQEFVLRNFGEYLSGDDPPSAKEAIEIIRDVAVDGLYEYLDENLDARNVVIGILTKYKQRSEWFYRDRLRDVARNGVEGKKGERALAVDLNSYVFDQGFEFFVEPVSASGEADVLLRQPEGRYLIIDAKYIEEKLKRADVVRKLASGFNQVFRYCSDFNESEGYLIVFSEHLLKFDIELEQETGFTYLPLVGKTIFYIHVNIANLPSASKQGKAQSFRIKRQELIEEIDVE